MPEKTPTDRKAKDEGFTFTVKGKKYHLPAITEAVAMSVPAGVAEDAIVEPDNDMAQARLGLCTLRAAKPDPEAYAALRAMTTQDMLEVVGAWMGGASGSSE